MLAEFEGKVHETDHRIAHVIIREMGPLLDFNIPR